MKYYAVGDIHGMSDLMYMMLDRIYALEPGTIVFLGDYIDRGPESKKVLDTLIAGPQKEGFSFITLMGNHEDMAIHALRANNWENMSHWLMNGGKYTLESFPEKLIDEKYIQWMERLWSHYETDKYFFVHAGIMPGIPFDKQRRFDKLWVRYPFLRSKVDHGKLVIHGHTPDINVEIKPNRINLDTGAYHTGTLSAGIFGDNGLESLIQVKGAAAPQYRKPIILLGDDD